MQTIVSLARCELIRNMLLSLTAAIDMRFTAQNAQQRLSESNLPDNIVKISTMTNYQQQWLYRISPSFWYEY